MSSPKPPALATWLLEHLGIGPNKDAVAGDLLEQFTQRPSAAWYWRQVLAAIALGLWKEWRTLWVAAGFTMLWTCAYVLWGPHLWRSAGFDAAMAWSVRHPWPGSTIYLTAVMSAIDVAPLVVTLSIYAGLVKRFSVRKVALGLLVGSFAVEASKIGLALGLLFSPPAVGRVPHLVYVLWGLPIFASLLLSLWIVGPRGKSKEAAQLLA